MEGDLLSGPRGDATVVSRSLRQQDERDIVDLHTEDGNISVTADHRVFVFEHGKVRVRAAGSLLNGGLLCTGLEQSIPFTASKRKASVAVFFMSLADDLPVYLDMLKFSKFVAKGCPGDTDYEYASAGSTCERCTSPVVPRSRPQSAPSRLQASAESSQGLLLSHTVGAGRDASETSGQVHIFFKQRRSDDPPVLEILRELADEVGCGYLLQDVNGGESSCKHKVSLSKACARELQLRIQPACERWLEQRRQMYKGRSSKLIWKQAE
eukprot:TRINITY_DN68849_c0_g1_i1.p1 TRINITY_DN68849_c0_g1~~TRINITY_DN68849_c0_g1_i1.p1  ORF type:complete len:267 (+),score=27.77 TRINITY_DN68849_c0_g1_i1:695-1495(+)